MSGDDPVGISMDRLSVRLVLFGGLAAVAAFHAGGAVDAHDALAAAALRDGTASSRAIALGVDLLRLVDVRIGLFRGAHLVAGMLLAIAAALSGGVAARLARGGAASLAAALLAGGAVLFGADTGRFGLEAGAVAPLLLALAGAAWAWTGDRPRAGLGGLLLGAAVAVHPAGLLALPGFLGLARALPAGTRGRAALGFVIGLGLLHLPPPGGSFGGALGAWWNGVHGAWHPAGAGDWARSAGSVAAGLYAGVGPVTLAAGVFGVALAARGGTRAFLTTFALAALAAILAARPDPAFSALAAWSLALVAAPALAAAEQRLGRAAGWLPGVALAAAVALVLTNRAEIDHSAERGTEWAMDSLAPLPEGALLLTRDPVQAALAADGAAAGTEVRLLPPGTPPGVARELFRAAAKDRPVFVDASLFFDVRWRTAAFGGEWRALPQGLTARILPTGEKIDDPEPADWSALHLEIDYPASPLRDGLGTQAFYARSLLQSAFLLVDLSFPDDAEHEFLYALSYEPCNHTLAAMGLARIFLERHQPGSAAQTLETYVREQDDGAWNAFQVLGSAYGLLRRDEDALRAYRQSLALVPPALKGEREKLQRLVGNLEQRAGAQGG